LKNIKEKFMPHVTAPIIIDGPNFINRILELEIDKLKFHRF